MMSMLTKKRLDEYCVVNSACSQIAVGLTCPMVSAFNWPDGWIDRR
jgi:hypothetical protein